MAIGDVYEVTDTQKLSDQTCLNVYFFRMTTATIEGDDAQQVCEGFIANMLPLLIACQVDEVIHTSVRAKNLFDATDSYEALISEGGATGAGYNSVFDAYGFRLNGDNAAVKNGAKRIPGVADVSVSDGVISGAGIIASLNALADGFSSNLLFGLLDAGTLVPVIVKRILVGDEYSLPTSVEEAVLSTVIDALWNTLVTSQVSRKVGRGS